MNGRYSVQYFPELALLTKIFGVCQSSEDQRALLLLQNVSKQYAWNLTYSFANSKAHDQKVGYFERICTRQKFIRPIWIARKERGELEWPTTNA